MSYKKSDLYVYMSQTEKEPNKSTEFVKRGINGSFVHKEPKEIVFGRKGTKFEGDFLYLALCCGKDQSESVSAKMHFVVLGTPKFLTETDSMGNIIDDTGDDQRILF